MELSLVRQVATRTIRTYLQSFLGFFVANATGATNIISEAVTDNVMIGPENLVQSIMVAAGLALAPTLITFLQNAIELLGSFDNPKLRA